MKTHLKLTGLLFAEMVQDLSRPHPFAAERVGFAFGRIGSLTDEDRLILLTRYHSIPDDQYMDDVTVGARIGPDAMTWAMQAVYHGRSSHEGIFHIHVHGHQGEPSMSSTDRRETPSLMPGFQSVGRDSAHGMIILSLDHCSASVWFPSQPEPEPVASTSVIGVPVGIFERGVSL